MSRPGVPLGPADATNADKSTKIRRPRKMAANRIITYFQTGCFPRHGMGMRTPVTSHHLNVLVDTGPNFTLQIQRSLV